MVKPTNDVYIKCANEDDFCTSQNPCATDQGDCDIHDECQDGLFCGSNNCPASLGFHSEFDCCYAVNSRKHTSIYETIYKKRKNYGQLVCSGDPEFIGDDFCDDDNNNEGCQWDGGDCCGGNTIFCSVCECFDPSA